MDSFQITFLGTGTSVGIPMIGCDCATCTSSDPRDQRSRSSILVRTPEGTYVVDTGPDFRTQCLREKLKELDAALYTHPHMDHLTGFDDLRRFCVPEDAVMPIYGTPACLQVIRRMYEHAFNGENRYRGYLKPEEHPITGPFTLGETLITPLPVKHGKVETVGYLFSRGGRKLCAYLSDMKEPLEGTVELMRGVDTLIVDALRHTPHPTHMNFEEALAFRTAVGPRQTWFTHIQCEILHAPEEQKLPEDVRIAYDGLKLSWP
ncbi:MBL fold metallo-hydrolase [Verrucomicrobium sp. BvORR106]|uniref:MBL fold metallo-hydrolase n=1 Tax=Verrucomicrobium sp. BvORR106 TaxID=1403819 RepID=UPI00057089F3|nr:MBL fold metallo-hydrolase [Verrucomicrobium sp. BvORR106]